MSDKTTATERLRALLDERGVEWDKGAFPNEASTYWQDTVARPWDTQRLFVYALLTPEQAVEATLGRGTCRNTQGDFDFMCSECGKCVDNGRVLGFNYCPKCGREIEA